MVRVPEQVPPAHEPDQDRDALPPCGPVTVRLALHEPPAQDPDDDPVQVCPRGPVTEPERAQPASAIDAPKTKQTTAAARVGIRNMG